MIDLLASAEQYRTHLLPIWEAVPAALRGKIVRPPQKRTKGPPLGNAILVGAWRDYRAAFEGGYTRIVYAEHGIGQSYDNGHPGYPGGEKRDRIGLFLSPNETAAAKDRAKNPNAGIVVVGDPVLDYLPTGTMGGHGPVAISFHWDCAVAPETRMTWRYWKEAVAQLTREVEVIGHAHPKAAVGLKDQYRRMGIRYVREWQDVCREASLYVCDNSSTLYEFAATGRPVVVLNHPHYRRDRNPGLRFWDAAGVGLQVDRPVALTETVLRAVEDPPGVQKDREAALDIAYGFRSGAAQRAADAISGWLA